jgi:pimeloyl-ACP methyl ester carboxylesterase
MLIPINGASLDVVVLEPTAATHLPLAVLLWNGAYCNRKQWSTVTPMLRAAGLRCITMDVRGVGASVAAPKEQSGSEQFSFEQYAADADALLSVLGIDRVVVLGMAWGARPALVFAATFPERVEALCLLDASVGQSTSKEWSMAQRTGTLLAKAKMERVGIVEPPPPTGFQEHSSRKMASMAMHATSKAPFHEAASFLSSVGTLRCNVLLCTGEFDPNLTAEAGGTIAIAEHFRPICAAYGRTVSLKVLEVTGHGSAVHRPMLVARTFVQHMHTAVLPVVGRDSSRL